jgi:hypothetical protein
MSQRTLSAEEADLMIGRTWFSDQPGDVVVHDEIVRVPELDAGSRANGSAPERVLFVHGLEVEGTLRVGTGIYVVLGAVHAKRIELGDGVLAVSGKVSADEYVHAPRTQGMFAVGSDATSDDATIPSLPPVQAPIVVWFDPRRRADLVFTMGPKALQRVPTESLPAALKALYDAPTESFKDPDAVRKVLRDGSWR